MPLTFSQIFSTNLLSECFLELFRKKEEMKIEQCMNSQRKKEGTNTSSPSKELSFLEALNRNSAILKVRIFLAFPLY